MDRISGILPYRLNPNKNCIDSFADYFSRRSRINPQSIAKLLKNCKIFFSDRDMEVKSDQCSPNAGRIYNFSRSFVIEQAKRVCHSNPDNIRRFERTNHPRIYVTICVPDGAGVGNNRHKKKRINTSTDPLVKPCSSWALIHLMIAYLSNCKNVEGVWFACDNEMSDACCKNCDLTRSNCSVATSASWIRDMAAL